jgi:hypothetical protein
MTADIQGVMGFALPNDVVQDSERKGRLRANTQSQDYSEVSEVVDFQQCDMHDLCSGKYDIDFFKMGFDKINLSDNPKLQTLLNKIKAQGFLEKEDIKNMRKVISGSVFQLSNGKRLRMVYVAGEGMLIRSSGPNGLAIQYDETLPTHSKQAAAMMVHGDQDVYGFPLKRIMKGAAPWIFRHNSPDGHNKFSPVNLVNIWIPLQQINMPLCLMDRTTLDNQKHQLRFEINVQDTLQRKADHARNDIWTFLHDPKQQWYFSSEMNNDNAYVFDTLGMAHGAAVLPGEKQAEQYFLRVSACQKALKEANRETFKENATKAKLDLPANMTKPLTIAIANLELVLENAAKNAEAIFIEGSSGASEWSKNAEAAKKVLIRRSIELRAVGLIY